MTLVQKELNNAYIWQYIFVTWVTLNTSSISFNNTSWTYQLKASVAPANAENKAITWKSSNTSVATVNSSWLVTPVWFWSATITVTTAEWWFTASATVSVVRKMDLLLIAWWWGGWGWWRYLWWGWGWAWWVICCTNYTLSEGAYAITIWAWGTWGWNLTSWANWWDSCLWTKLKACWGWGWAWCCAAIRSWWSWWWASAACSCDSCTTYIYWWSWTSWQWYTWWYAIARYSYQNCGWGGWGWARWNGGNATYSSSTYWKWWAWGLWLCTNISWAYECFAWWGGWWVSWCWCYWWWNGSTGAWWWGSATTCWSWWWWAVCCCGASWWSWAWWLLIVRYPCSCGYTISWGDCKYLCSWYCIHCFINSWSLYIWPKLPSTYQELEYIQSTGTQYINSWYVDSKDTEIEVDMQFTSTSPTQQRLFGHWMDSDYGGYSYEAYINWSTQWARANKDWVWQWQTTNVSADTSRHTFILNNSNYRIYTGTTLTYCWANSCTITRANDSWMPLLARRFKCSSSWWTMQQYACAKLYGAKIRNGWTLVRDFVPSCRKSDWVIWLYDLVTCCFCTNAWTWTFTKWPNV